MGSTLTPETLLTNIVNCRKFRRKLAKEAVFWWEFQYLADAHLSLSIIWQQSKWWLMTQVWVVCWNCAMNTKRRSLLFWIGWDWWCWSLSLLCNLWRFRAKTVMSNYQNDRSKPKGQVFVLQMLGEFSCHYGFSQTLAISNYTLGEIAGCIYTDEKLVELKASFYLNKNTPYHLIFAMSS